MHPQFAKAAIGHQLFLAAVMPKPTPELQQAARAYVAAKNAAEAAAAKDRQVRRFVLNSRPFYAAGIANPKGNFGRIVNPDDDCMIRQGDATLYTNLLLKYRLKAGFAASLDIDPVYPFRQAEYQSTTRLILAAVGVVPDLTESGAQAIARNAVKSEQAATLLLKWLKLDTEWREDVRVLARLLK